VSEPDAAAKARAELLQRWPLWRSLGHLAWWSVGFAPFVCAALLLCMLGADPPDDDRFPWRLLAVGGGIGLVVSIACVVVWLQKRRQGLPSLLRCLLLALPPSYLPTLFLSIYVRDLPLDQVLVPKTFALWGAIYAAAVIGIYLLRQREWHLEAESDAKGEGD